MFQKPLLMAALLGSVAFFSCQDQNDPEPSTPESTIQTIIFEEPLRSYYNHGVTVDLNDDGLDDFLFGVLLEGNTSSVTSRFQVSSLRDSKVLGVEPTAQALAKDAPISAEASENWTIVSCSLISRKQIENQPDEWSGPWQQTPEAYLGVSIRLGEVYHYGWIKVMADPEHQELLIQQIAFNTTPGAAILAGQSK